MLRELAQALNPARLRDHLVGRRGVAQLQRAAQIEPLDHRARVGAVEHAGEDVADGRMNQIARHLLGASQLAFVLELELAGDRGQRCVHVGHARHHHLLAVLQRAPLRVRDHQFERADRQPLADARALVDLTLAARLERNLLHDLAHVRRDVDLERPGTLEPRLLRRDRHRVVARDGIVRPDLRADAVLERRDDLAARRVVLRVRREDEQHVQPEADRIPLNLDVAFLQDVEQADLNLAGQVGQLVDREDAAVRPRQQAVVHRQLVGQVEAGLRRLDRIDVADHVGDRDVGRRELLHEARLARQPGDRHVVALRADARAARRAERRERIVVDLTAGNHRNLFVQQIDQAAQDAALRLTAQAEQDEVVPRQDRVHELRDDRLVVSDDAGKQPIAGVELPHEVVADFLLHRTGPGARLLAQVTEGLDQGRHNPILLH